MDRFRKRQHSKTGGTTGRSFVAEKGTYRVRNVSAIARMQGQFGNGAIQRMFRAGVLQAKLEKSVVQRQGKEEEPIQKQAEEEEAVQGKFIQLQQLDEEVTQKKEEEEEPVQKKEGKSPEATSTPNEGGLPGNLRSGLEALSGFDLSPVRVHYNSLKPSQVRAHAFTQGREIHVAPGQERHLPHEGWHIVQQAQGRVKPTRQLKGKGIALNDDAGLEKEADVMGGKALSLGSGGAETVRKRTPLAGGNNIQASAGVIMRKERGSDAKKISDLVRNSWKVEPGNRSEEIIANDGKSYAGFQLLWFLYHKDASGPWLSWENIKKRATLAYDLKAANCDQYGDISYCVARSKYNANSLVIEQQPGHTYATMWDKEDNSKPGKQAVIDPWVRRGHLREQEKYYMSGYSQYNKISCDGAGWYKKGYTDKLKKAYSLKSWMAQQAKIGKEKAERKKKGEDVPGMY